MTNAMADQAKSRRMRGKLLSASLGDSAGSRRLLCTMISMKEPSLREFLRGDSTLRLDNFNAIKTALPRLLLILQTKEQVAMLPKEQLEELARTLDEPVEHVRRFGADPLFKREPAYIKRVRLLLQGHAPASAEQHSAHLTQSLRDLFHPIAAEKPTFEEGEKTRGKSVKVVYPPVSDKKLQEYEADEAEEVTVSDQPASPFIRSAKDSAANHERQHPQHEQVMEITEPTSRDASAAIMDWVATALRLVESRDLACLELDVLTRAGVQLRVQIAHD